MGPSSASSGIQGSNLHPFGNTAHSRLAGTLTRIISGKRIAVVAPNAGFLRSFFPKICLTADDMQ
jgi:hypothetical protein